VHALIPRKASQNQTVLITAPPCSRSLALDWNSLRPSTRYPISPANIRSLTKRLKYRLPAPYRVPLQQKHRRVQVVTLSSSPNSTSWNCISRHREDWPLSARHTEVQTTSPIPASSLPHGPHLGFNRSSKTCSSHSQSSACPLHLVLSIAVLLLCRCVSPLLLLLLPWPLVSVLYITSR
jgi:hypothetical protein